MTFVEGGRRLVGYLVHDQTALLARVNGLIGALQGGGINTAPLGPTESLHRSWSIHRNQAPLDGNGYAYATVTLSAIRDALRSARADNANASAGDGMIGSAREVLARAREALERADRTVRQTGVPDVEPQPQPRSTPREEAADMLFQRRQASSTGAGELSDADMGMTQTQTLQQLRARLTAVTEASAARRAERGGAGGEEDPDKRPQRRRIFFER
ncbi:hypothetical protein B0H16DRAFT_1689005 [Mycena metata]|uniref:Uncharacterized protein n=1 Tax=Mycena metata TaxID=1033252 RepID=A0AAD7JCS3_9AGAR|nr:hypothetical protein B0H16DRAFT_1689005 [Mycena metata]